MSGTVDFIGIGAARSGTTWIAEVLRAHPEICISEPKEVRYFNRHVLPFTWDKAINRPAKLRLKAVKRVGFSMAQALVDARLGWAVAALRKFGAHGQIHRGNSSPLRYPSLAEVTRRHLVDLFADDIADLESLLGRRLDHWRSMPS